MDIKANYNPPLLKEGLYSGESVPEESYRWSRSFYFLAKRAFDVFVSFVVILCVLSWLLPVLALLILLDSGMPIFFLQKRIGRGGQVFTCYKLRTMVLNKEADEQAALEYDGRITRAGRLLRKSNLDELPQFLNVLSGSMSIVGPRPHMIMDCRFFASVVPGYDFRNHVRPGITGLAQVKGFHGPVKEIGNIFGRYQWDAFYIRHAGFLMDLRIIRMTIADFFLIVRHFIFIRKYAYKSAKPSLGSRIHGDKDLYQ
jgi:putative colanic acid biosynthesis UDP-glucose lipid carrier transferase